MNWAAVTPRLAQVCRGLWQDLDDHIPGYWCWCLMQLLGAERMRRSKPSQLSLVTGDSISGTGPWLIILLSVGQFNGSIAEFLTSVGCRNAWRLRPRWQSESGATTESLAAITESVERQCQERDLVPELARIRSITEPSNEAPWYLHAAGSERTPSRAIKTSRKCVDLNGRSDEPQTPRGQS